MDACNLRWNSVNATESCIKQGAVAACHLIGDKDKQHTTKTLVLASGGYDRRALDYYCCWSIFLSSVRIGLLNWKPY